VSAPIRVQLRRTKGWRIPENTVKVDRSSIFGNPFFSHPGLPRSRSFEAMCFRDWIYEQLGAVRIGTSEQRDFRQFMQQMSCVDVVALRAKGERMKDGIHLLRGKNLACWCPLISHGCYCPCHADVLLSFANDIPLEEVIRENTRRAKGEAL
jgi:hypothetical protein